MRAIRARYNPYVQARARVDQLRKLGHSADKVSSGGQGVECPGVAQGLWGTLLFVHVRFLQGSCM